MKDQQNEQNTAGDNNQKDDSIGGVNVNAPDPETQNDTGYAGTTNSVSENHQDKDGYKIAIEDTMIGYDGDDDQMNMSLDNDSIRSKDTNTGAGDNN